MYHIIQQIEKFIIINFYPLFFLIFSILFGNIGGYISMIVATLSIMLAIILSINYKKKDKLFNIAKYYIINMGIKVVATNRRATHDYKIIEQAYITYPDYISNISLFLLHLNLQSLVRYT